MFEFSFDGYHGGEISQVRDLMRGRTGLTAPKPAKTAVTNMFRSINPVPARRPTAVSPLCSHFQYIFAMNAHRCRGRLIDSWLGVHAVLSVPFVKNLLCAAFVPLVKPNYTLEIP